MIGDYYIQLINCFICQVTTSNQNACRQQLHNTDWKSPLTKRQRKDHKSHHLRAGTTPAAIAKQRRTEHAGRRSPLSPHQTPRALEVLLSRGAEICVTMPTSGGRSLCYRNLRQAYHALKCSKSHLIGDSLMSSSFPLASINSTP